MKNRSPGINGFRTIAFFVVYQRPARGSNQFEPSPAAGIIACLFALVDLRAIEARSAVLHANEKQGFIGQWKELHLHLDPPRFEIIQTVLTQCEIFDEPVGTLFHGWIEAQNAVVDSIREQFRQNEIDVLFVLVELPDLHQHRY